MLSDLNGHTARALQCKKATVMLGSTTSRAVSLAAAPGYLQKQSGTIGRAVWPRCKANTLGYDQTILCARSHCVEPHRLLPAAHRVRRYKFNVSVQCLRFIIHTVHDALGQKKVAR